MVFFEIQMSDIAFLGLTKRKEEWLLSVSKRCRFIFFLYFSMKTSNHKSAKVPAQGHHNFGPSFIFDLIPGLGLDQ